MGLCLAQDPEADALLDRDPFALLTGMLLDQQQPMERAFLGPYRLITRLGLDRLDPVVIAEMDPAEFAAVVAQPPAVHRFPGSMSARVQALARCVVDSYNGDASLIWTRPKTGAALLSELGGLPGFGPQKSQVFLALLGKQRGVRPRGWRTAAGRYGQDGVQRSVADVVDANSLIKVREAKRAAKAAAR